MTKKLVFIHGRAQQNKESVGLKADWVEDLRGGLRDAGLSLPITDLDIRFPYYGDTLHQLSQGVAAEDAAAIVVRGTGPGNDAERRFIKDVLDEVRTEEDISDADIEAEIGADVVNRGLLNYEWVQGLLKVLDRKTSFGSGASIALFTKDVYHYLTNPVLRAHIDTGVTDAMRSEEPTVVVSHSLGTVIAYSILRREGKALGWKVPTFITLGSPLGITRIRETLAAQQPLAKPSCVDEWSNAYDERDVVALYPLERPHFDISPNSIRNKRNVRNGTSNHHGISGYLGDAEIARWIYDALA